MQKESETNSGFCIELVVKNSGDETGLVTSVLINSC